MAISEGSVIVKIASTPPNEVQFQFRQIVSETDGKIYYATARNRRDQNPEMAEHGPIGHQLVLRNLNVNGIYRADILIYALKLIKSGGFEWEEIFPEVISVVRQAFSPKPLIFVPLVEQADEATQKLLSLANPEGEGKDNSDSKAQSVEDPSVLKFKNDWNTLISGQKIKLVS